MTPLLLALCVGALAAPPPTAPVLAGESVAVVAAEEEFARIVPGDGFTTAAAPTSASAARAASPPIAIAKFDVVPEQVIGGDIFIGVVAFHMNGIANVAFSAAGGPWVKVSRAQRNPQTDVWEYTALLRATDLPDGRFEVRAIATPNKGTARVLEPLFLYANGHGSLPFTDRYVDADGSDLEGDGSRKNPFNTISAALKSVGPVANNVTIFLGPGEYDYNGSGKKYNGSAKGPAAGIGWTTITSGPGVDPESVRIVSADPKGFLPAARLRLVNLTIDQRQRWLLMGPPGSERTALWLDHVTANGPGPLPNSSPTGAGIAPLYVTSTRVNDYQNGGVSGALCRDTHLTNIGSDAFFNAELLLNSSVDGIDRGGSDAHPDVWQLYGPKKDFDNVILYNVRASRAKAQGVFVKDVKSISNVAIVNFSMDRVESAFISQWFHIPSNHVLIWHVSMPNSTWAWRGSRPTNVSVVGSVWSRVVSMPWDGRDALVDSRWYRSNHFVNGGESSLVVGDDASTGDPGLIERDGEFVPKANSVLKRRLQRVVVPTDLGGDARGAEPSVGAVN